LKEKDARDFTGRELGEKRNRENEKGPEEEELSVGQTDQRKQGDQGVGLVGGRRWGREKDINWGCREGEGLDNRSTEKG